MPVRNRTAARFGEVATTTARRQPVTPSASARKYTVKLATGTADAFDEAVLRLQKRLGRRVDKSEVVRELVALLADDPILVEQLAERLQGHGMP